VIPRVLAIDGVPRFKLDSPPASEQMRKTFALQFDKALLSHELAVEVDSPHCTASLSKSSGNITNEVHLALLDTARTWRPRELKAFIRSGGEIVAQFPIYCEYKSDVRIIAARKQFLNPSTSPRNSYRVYIGESVRNLGEDAFGVSVVLESEKLAIPFNLELKENGGLRRLDVSYEKISAKLKSGAKAKLVFETNDGTHQDSIELWFE
jgi:hypothetical protein